MNLPKSYRVVSFLRSSVIPALLFCGLITGRAQPQPVVASTLHSFGSGSDGSGPVSCLILASDNALYGSTPFGGTNNYGTIFKVNRDGSGYAVLHNFDVGDDDVTTFFSKPGPFVIRASDGFLYGGTQGGTIYPYGVLFRMNTDGSDYTVLNVFTNITPTSLFQGTDGALYGAGMQGVFKFDAHGSNYTVLRAFNYSTDGRDAYGKLMQGSDGFLYGTAEFGGTNNVGTVFKLDTNGTTFTLLHTFATTNDGTRPFAGVIEGDDGALYGTTYAGGTNAVGTIYKINRDGSGYQILHDFQTNGVDGKFAYGGLVEGLNHLLYGATPLGGTNAAGITYEIGTDGSGYAPIMTFDGPHGIAGYSALVPGPAYGGSGVLYGLAEAGGAFSYGCVFGLIVNPPLTITPAVTSTGNNPVVVWPAWALNYQLQTTTNLTSGTWTTITNSQPVTGIQLTNPPPGSYYRLIFQQSQ